jgi:bifunctional DNA-binding transcriptional regulator/antitoxin component of YhaV-PrlF toxin-antitoxin module
MTKATISSDGNLPLPEAVRRLLRLEPGAEVTLEVDGETLLMNRAHADSTDWRSMEGMVAAGPSLTEALVEEHAAELAAQDARFDRS